MLQPSLADFFALFLFLVVFPVVIYILLGKWNEAVKKRGRASLLAQHAAEEAYNVEDMAAASVFPPVPAPVPLPNGSFHPYASTPYPVNSHDQCESASLPNTSFHQCAKCYGPATTRCSRCKSVRYCSGKCQILHWREIHKHECQMLEKNTNASSSKPALMEDLPGMNSVDSNLSAQFVESSAKQPWSEKDPSDHIVESPISTPASTGINPASVDSSESPLRQRIRQDRRASRKGNDSRSRSHHGRLDGLNLDQTNACEGEVDTSDREKVLSGGFTSQGNTKMKETIPSQGRNVVSSNLGIKKMFSLMKSSKLDKQAHSTAKTDRHKKLKMLFPYEEFVKYFLYEAINVSPRGLINCGNSCYANAVLQCLTFTKPLTAFLLHRSHSQSCCRRDWCLMCELEKHMMMLREGGEPLSPNSFLLRMQSIHSQIGKGSQEDAHEFLRFFVGSMQSISLEGLGGEKAVEPRLQETTFIQHIFGGRLRSKVKCLRCHHESECSENIMDLTLEIYGWVESLEDALTQFTSPEDLDGENMYRCGRCSSYVRAQKQLSIEEAPNIMTIVLKRFQGGCYGKINKCISFPEMLDMIPFMTGTDDMPPLYMLYAVIVHLDTLNASFSGHYISYVKDTQGNWFRTDDTKVQPVPMSQVMSEGAYILFYKRSSPRPDRTCNLSKSTRNIAPRPCSTKPQQPLRLERRDKSREHRLKEGVDIINHTSGSVFRPPITGMYSESVEFPDAAASDWSVFTSSDEAASFTTESTRDSCSTVDCVDASTPNLDPIFSPFISAAPVRTSKRTIACNMFSGTRPHTTFFSENKGFVVNSHLSSVQEDDDAPADEGFFVDSRVNYGYQSRYIDPQTSYSQLL